MKIYYIRYSDDNTAEDGIWLDSQRRDQFFLKEEKAISECADRNAVDFRRHIVQQEKKLEEWNLTEKAFRAVEATGLDPHKVFPYHKVEFKGYGFKALYVVDSLEVVE